MELVGNVMGFLRQENDARGQFVVDPPVAVDELNNMRLVSRAFAAEARLQVPELEGGFVGFALRSELLGTGALEATAVAKRLPRLRQLTLHYPGITLRPGPVLGRLTWALGQARCLRQLSLQGVSLRATHVTGVLGALPPTLRELDLAHNWLEASPILFAALAPFAGLHTLSLRDNWLDGWPLPAGTLTRLRVLDLSDNELVTLPAALQALGGLEALDVSRTKLTELPSWLDKMTELRSFRASGNRLSRLPEAVGSLTSLQALAVDDNQLTALPTALFACRQLARLEANNNQLGEIDEALGALSALHQLHLANNGLRRLPASLRLLDNLQVLELQNNALRELDRYIFALPRLEALDVRGNRFFVFGGTRMRLHRARLSRRFVHLRD